MELEMTRMNNERDIDHLNQQKDENLKSIEVQF